MRNYEVVEFGNLLFRSMETSEKASYNECLIWLGNYNLKHPRNKAKIQTSKVTQLALFSE